MVLNFIHNTRRAMNKQVILAAIQIASIVIIVFCAGVIVGSTGEAQYENEKLRAVIKEELRAYSIRPFWANKLNSTTNERNK